MEIIEGLYLILIIDRKWFGILCFWVVVFFLLIEGLMFFCLLYGELRVYLF